MISTVPGIDFLSCLSSSQGSIGNSLAPQSSHLNNALFYYLPASRFRFSLFRRRAFLCHFFVFVGHVLIAVYKHVVGEHLPQTSQITTQRNQPCARQQSKCVPIRARQRKQSDRDSEKHYAVENLHSSLYSQDERRNRNLPVYKKKYHGALGFVDR